MSDPFQGWTLFETTPVATYAAGRDYALDDSGDIDLSTGDIRFTTGLAAVAQDIYIALRMFQGEWFLNREIGVPYLPNDIVAETDALLGQRFSALRARAAFRTAIARVEGVEEITKLEVSFNAGTRVMTVAFEVKTVAGTIVATEEI